jgi:hypothetical protein
MPGSSRNSVVVVWHHKRAKFLPHLATVARVARLAARLSALNPFDLRGSLCRASDLVFLSAPEELLSPTCHSVGSLCDAYECIGDENGPFAHQNAHLRACF